MGEYKQAIVLSSVSTEAFKRNPIDSYPMYKMKNLIIEKLAKEKLGDNFDMELIMENKSKISSSYDFNELVERFEMNMRNNELKSI
jgi:hypothetical protein